MEAGNFIDYVKICTRSGAGGAGASHFRREKHVEMGGPDGGDGGRGGHIILKGSHQLWTLLHLKYRKHIFAKGGGKGEGAKRKGADGEDVILEVPIGTVAKDAETGEVILEITADGEERIMLPGGKGGLGNSHFKTSTNQAPTYAQGGQPGIEKWVVLELKLLADVGLVGFPNAGKSTLLSKISAARPKIGDYPFTTITPNLGVVDYYDYKSFVMADIPGLIEGASDGKGLGIRFLRHIERNSALLFLVAADSEDIYQDYKILLNELEKYNPELLDKKRVLGISKIDLLQEDEKKDILKKVPVDIPIVAFSSYDMSGVQELKDVLWKILN